jgi:hypothetical protein
MAKYPALSALDIDIINSIRFSINEHLTLDIPVEAVDIREFSEDDTLRRYKRYTAVFYSNLWFSHETIEQMIGNMDNSFAFYDDLRITYDSVTHTVRKEIDGIYEYVFNVDFETH